MSDMGSVASATAETVSGAKKIARRARTIENDLKKRRLKNEQRERMMSLVERWAAAHDRAIGLEDICCYFSDLVA
jgi:hypothetical protein